MVAGLKFSTGATTSWAARRATGQLLISFRFEQLAVDGGEGVVATDVDGAGARGVDVDADAEVEVEGDVDGGAAGGGVAEVVPPHPVAHNPAAVTASVATTTARWRRAGTGGMLTGPLRFRPSPKVSGCTRPYERAATPGRSSGAAAGGSS